MIQVAELEREIFYLLNHSISTPFFDGMMVFVTGHVPWFFLLFFILNIAFDRNPGRILLLFCLLLIGLIAGDALSNILKHLIKRPRPFLVLQDARVLVGKGLSFAMPSGHATNTVSVATVAYLFIKNKVDIPPPVQRILKGYLLVLSVAVCLSRVYVGVHWPADVLAGAIIGISTGASVYGLYHWISRYYRTHSLRE